MPKQVTKAELEQHVQDLEDAIDDIADIIGMLGDKDYENGVRREAAKECIRIAQEVGRSNVIDGNLAVEFVCKAISKKFGLVGGGHGKG